jgi:alcohol dehydrogenase
MAAQMVKAAVLVEPRKVELREFPYPEIGPEEAVLRVEMAGVCGTDAHFYTGTAKPAYPQILGHEILGHISALGSEFAARHHLREGDRVMVNSIVPCMRCAMCEQGLHRMCSSGIGYGTRTSATRPPHLWGAYGEYMYLVPNVSIHHVPAGVSAKAATFATSSLANGIRWARTIGGATIGKPIVIQGAGPQGLASVIAAKESGATPIIVTGLGSDQARLELARELGADVCVNVEAEDVVEVVR